MAEIINLATFSLDTAKLQNSLDQLQDTYFDLRKEQKAYTDQGKETQKQIESLAKTQKLLTDSAGDNSEAIAANDKEMQDLLKTQKDLYKSEQNLATQMGTVKKEINQTTTQLRAYQDAEGKTKSLIDLGNVALGRSIKNKNDARAANIALNNVANQLNPAIEEEAKLLVKLNKQIDDNTDFIKGNSSENAKRIYNIGNYKSALEGLDGILSNYGINTQQIRTVVTGFTSTVSDASDVVTKYTNSAIQSTKATLGFKTSSQLASQAQVTQTATTETQTVANEALTVTQNATTVATTATTTSMKLLKIAIIATGIGALVILAVSLVTALRNNEEASNKFSRTLSGLKGIVNAVMSVLVPLGSFLIDKLAAGFDIVGNAAEKGMKLLSKGLNALGFDEASKSVDNFSESISKTVMDTQKLEAADQKLAKAQRESQKIQFDYQKQAEKIRQQRDDETNSISKRIELNNQLGSVLQKQANEELKIANQAVANANLRIKLTGKDRDNLDELAEAQTRVSDIQERITGQESEQLANLNSLRKESADKQKELQDQAIEKALTNSRAEIDLFIATQGFKKKSLEKEYAFNKILTDKELADLKLQYDKKKISAKEYEVGKAQIVNDFATKNAEITIANAELEVNAELEKNQRILDSDQYLSDEQLKIKQDALNSQLIAETNFQKIRLEQGAINQQEYDAEIAKIKAESKAKADELIAQNLAEEQQKALIDLDNKKIIEEENFIAQAQIEKDRNDILLAQELESAKKSGADIQLIKDKYAQMDKEIEEQKMANKLSLASQTFGDLATIFGEESKAGKAAAIAQTTIDTYKSAIAAYSSLSGIPIVGPALGAIAAGAAVKTGFDAVKKITATKTPTFKTPSYATGVIGLRGSGSGTSDNISANLSAGESVITAKATSMYANELSQINQAGGGVGLTGASNIINQNELNSSAKNSQMAQMIAEAVAVGAEKGTAQGSQKGITNLSDNRKVMQDAKF